MICSGARLPEQLRVILCLFVTIIGALTIATDASARPLTPLDLVSMSRVSHPAVSPGRTLASVGAA